MSRNFVWAIDYHGSLFKLNLGTQEWSQVSGHKTNSRKDTFKRITTTTNCAWAICGDQNIYVNVFETDLPIKLQVNCYENERWSVLHGWGKKSVSAIYCSNHIFFMDLRSLKNPKIVKMANSPIIG